MIAEQGEGGASSRVRSCTLTAAILAFNMLVLYLLFLGRRLEHFVGPYAAGGHLCRRLLGGSAGALRCCTARMSAVGLLGASGAVYGVMGAAFVVEYLRGGNPWRDGLGSLIIINVVISFLIPNISVGGHLGGLAAGVLAASPSATPAGGGTRRRWPSGCRTSPSTHGCAARRSMVWALLAVIGAAAFAGALAAATTWRDPLF